MAKSIVPRKHAKTQNALIMVIATTILALIASGLKAMDDERYSEIHTLSQVILVAAFVFYLFTLSRSKESKSVSVEPSREGQTYLLSPSWPKQVLCITDPLGMSENVKQFRKLPWQTREAIRAVVAQNAAIDLNFVRLIALFPQIVALDLQGSDVDPAVWDELAHFEQLQLILAHGAVSQNDLRDLVLTIPEIKICIEPSQLQTQ